MRPLHLSTAYAERRALAEAHFLLGMGGTAGTGAAPAADVPLHWFTPASRMRRLRLRLSWPTRLGRAPSARGACSTDAAAVPLGTQPAQRRRVASATPAAGPRCGEPVGCGADSVATDSP